MHNSAITVLFVLSAFSLSDAAGNVRSFDERVRQEGPDAWLNFRKAIDNVQGSYTYTTFSQARGEPARQRTSRLRYKVRLEHGLQLTERLSPSDGRVQDVSCRNPEYSFRLFRPETDAPFQVLNVTRRSAVDEKQEASDLVAILEMPTRISHVRLDDILENTEFTLTSVKAMQHLGQEMLRIEFDWRPQDETWLPDDPEWLAQHGRRLKYWAILNPGKLWTVYKSGAEIFWGTRNYIIEYGWSLNGVPFPSKIVLIDRDWSGFKVNEWTWQFDKPTICTASGDEFTLGAYGLPDVFPDARDGMGVRLWLVLLSVCGLAVSALIAYLVRRRRTAESPDLAEGTAPSGATSEATERSER